MNRLTGRQEQILNYIKEYLAETGFPPTRSEIAQEMGFKSPNAAEEHLRALARKGAIEMLPGTSRGIRLPISEQLGLPIVGQVAAGSPILAEEFIDDYCDIPRDLFSPRADYLLAVKGTSMIDVGIYEDDLLAVHKTDQARGGGIVVAPGESRKGLRLDRAPIWPFGLIFKSRGLSPVFRCCSRGRFSRS